MVKKHSYTNRFELESESRDKVVALLHDPERFLRVPNSEIVIEKGEEEGEWIVKEDIPSLSLQSTTNVKMSPQEDGLHVVRRTQGVQLVFTSTWTVSERSDGGCTVVEEVDVEASWMVMPIVKTRLAANQSRLEENLRCAVAGGQS